MKKLGILLLACITAINLWAEEFKIGKLTFEIETPTTVGLIDADGDITKAFLSETIDYQGKTYTLTEIRGWAFSECSSLTSVTIPNSVTSIGEYAFGGCALKSITIPNSVTEIGWGAFAYCEFTSVTIPNSVTSIGDYAFYGCYALKWITIPNSVTSIGCRAFEDTEFYNDPSNWENGALYINNCLIAFNKNYVGNYTIKSATPECSGWGRIIRRLQQFVCCAW